MSVVSFEQVVGINIGEVMTLADRRVLSLAEHTATIQHQFDVSVTLLS